MKPGNQNPAIGKHWESWVAQRLIGLGHQCRLISHGEQISGERIPFDVLVDDCVGVEVKFVTPTYCTQKGQRVWAHELAGWNGRKRCVVFDFLVVIVNTRYTGIRHFVFPHYLITGRHYGFFVPANKQLFPYEDNWSLISFLPRKEQSQ